MQHCISNMKCENSKQLFIRTSSGLIQSRSTPELIQLDKQGVVELSNLDSNRSNPD